MILSKKGVLVTITSTFFYIDFSSPSVEPRSPSPDHLYWMQGPK